MQPARDLPPLATSREGTDARGGRHGRSEGVHDGAMCPCSMLDVVTGACGLRQQSARRLQPRPGSEVSSTCWHPCIFTSMFLIFPWPPAWLAGVPSGRQVNPACMEPPSTYLHVRLFSHVSFFTWVPPRWLDGSPVTATTWRNFNVHVVGSLFLGRLLLWPGHDCIHPAKVLGYPRLEPRQGPRVQNQVQTHPHHTINHRLTARYPSFLVQSP